VGQDEWEGGQTANQCGGNDLTKKKKKKKKKAGTPTNRWEQGWWEKRPRVRTVQVNRAKKQRGPELRWKTGPERKREKNSDACAAAPFV